MQISDARRSSPIKVVVTRVGTPERNPISSFRESGRAKSAEGYNAIKTQKEDPGITSSRSSLRPCSARDDVTSRLQVPGMRDHAGNSLSPVKHGEHIKTCNGNDSSFSNRPVTVGSSPRSKSERNRLPTGSPTFQRVLYEILAETEIDSETTDDEKELKPCLKVKNTKKKKVIDSRRRPSLSPSVQFRRKSAFS